MPYHLPAHISFGVVEDQIILLDLLTDRYLMIGEAEARALLCPDGRDTDPAFARLVRKGLVGLGSGPPIAPVAFVPVHASAQETGHESHRLPLSEVAIWRFGAAISLRVRGLAATIARWRSIRARPYPVREWAGHEGDGPCQDLASAIARGYAAARLFIPARRLCIPDSLALARILWRRGLAADVYFGVQLAPFTAHCWVQCGSLLLSDPVDRVAEFTPVFRL